MRRVALLKMVQHPRWDSALALRATHDQPFVDFVRKHVARREWSGGDDRAWFFHADEAPVVIEEAKRRFDEVFWDRMILRDWEDLAVPAGTEIPERTIEPAHFAALGVRPFAPLAECRGRFRDLREAFYAGKVPRTEYERITEAFERISFFCAELDLESGAFRAADAEDDDGDMGEAGNGKDGGALPLSIGPSFEEDGGEARARAALEEMARRLGRT